MPKIEAKAFQSELKELQKKHGMEDKTITIIKPNKATEKEPFVKVFQFGLSYFVETLSPSGCKLFMYFVNEMRYGNFVEVDQKVIMEKLKIKRTALNKGLTELKELNVIAITEDLNDRRRNTYMINHYVAWKGNPGDRVMSFKKNHKLFAKPTQIKLQLEPKVLEE